MEFLTQLFGNLTSGIIRLGVAVGILAAVYFFVLHPILNSTDHAVDSANQAFEHSFENTKEIQAEVNKTVEDANRQVQVQVEHSFHTAKVEGNPIKLLHCVQRAHGNVHRIERCTNRY
jgi:flagellar basal body-associated protein FliL